MRYDVPAKISLWLEDAIALAAFAALLALAPFVLSLEREMPDLKREAQKITRESCAITIQQFGPGERWIPYQPATRCAAAAVEVPNYILSHPLERK